MTNHYQLPKLLLPKEYVAEATRLVKKSTKRVYLVCLNFNRCAETNKLIKAIIEAAKRGVDVRIDNDLLTFICDHDNSIASRLVGSEMVRTRSIRKDFVQSGAKFSWLGTGRIPYLIGRTHSKWTIVDDDIFSFGGVNLSRSGIAERTDYMFHINNPKLADRLTLEQRRLEQTTSLGRQIPDVIINSDIGSIIMDNGRFNRSTIYRNAVKLAKEADHLLLVSQYCPSGKLAKIIRSKGGELYFNPKGSANNSINNFMIGSKKNTALQKNLYKRDRYIHSKFIIGTMPNGSKCAITGSHNFAAISGRAGTREIALKTTDQRIISQLESFFADYIA